MNYLLERPSLNTFNSVIFYITGFCKFFALKTDDLISNILFQQPIQTYLNRFINSVSGFLTCILKCSLNTYMYKIFRLNEFN